MLDNQRIAGAGCWQRCDACHLGPLAQSFEKGPSARNGTKAIIGQDFTVHFNPWETCQCGPLFAGAFLQCVPHFRFEFCIVIATVDLINIEPCCLSTSVGVGHGRPICPFEAIQELRQCQLLSRWASVVGTGGHVHQASLILITLAIFVRQIICQACGAIHGFIDTRICESTNRIEREGDDIIYTRLLQCIQQIYREISAVRSPCCSIP
mmetsp:Transcript_166890/g.320596  ORF Transcript_166890/g.320596 Transcript_166890/m.320596 type:complete len:209 (+) Transcript_166890:100-726(+)